MGGIKRVVERICVWWAAAGGMVLIVLMLLSAVHGVGRKFGAPIPNTVEISQTFLFAAVCLSLGYVTLRRGHVNIELLTQRLPVRAQAGLDAIVAIVAAIVFGILTWSSGVVGYEAYLVKAVKIAQYPWPIWPFQLMLPVGLGMFTLQLVVNAFADINKARRAG